MTKILKAHAHGHIKVFIETYPQPGPLLLSLKVLKEAFNVGS